MKRLIQLVATTALVSLAASCAPDAGPVCDHLQKVMEGDNDRPSWLDTDDKCHERYDNVKNRYGVNTYRREVECILASDTAFQIRKCMKKEDRFRNGPNI